MGLWKKFKDVIREQWEYEKTVADRKDVVVSEERSNQGYDILNDFDALEKDLRQRRIMGGRLCSTAAMICLHLYRQQIWGSGEHPPLIYPIKLEPPYRFLSIYELNSYRHVRDVPGLEPNLWSQVNQNSWCRFTIGMSPDDNITGSQAEQFWLSLRGITQPVSFEIVGNCEEVIFQFLCRPEDRQYIASQLTAYCPSGEINPEGDDPDYFLQLYNELTWRLGSKLLVLPYEFGLRYPFHRPLRVFTNLNPDPLNSLVNSMGDLEEDEGFVFQGLVMPTRNDWRRDLLEVYFPIELWEVFVDYFVTAEEQTLVKEKLKSYPFFAVALRVMTFYRRDLKSNTLGNAVRSIALFDNEHNSIKPLDMREYPDCDESSVSQILVQDLIHRQTRRGGMLLNPRELSGICHFPSKSLQHPKLFRGTHARAKAPDIALQGGIMIGINEVRGKQNEVFIPADRRDLHTYIVGSTGTGKSTLLLNMIKQDMGNGEGVGVIDPHGDLISEILPRVPEDRVDDVVLFDPADIEYPIGLNLLSASGFRETDLVCSDLLSVFERMFDASSWGDNIEQIMRMCILTLLEAGGYTLRDIRRLLTNEVFRSQVVSRLSDPDLVEFWATEFTTYSKATVSAVQRRLSRLLFSSPVRNILSQKESKLDFMDIMDNGKILLCNLSKGKIGEDNSDLFGRLLVSKIQISAMTRADRPREERQPFHLYVDEFQNFVTSSFGEILSEARKYQLCLVLANQFTRQLSRQVHDSVFGNVGTLIAFRLGLDDAQDLQRELGKFTHEDILNLEPYHAYVRIGRAQDTFSMTTLPPPEGGDPIIAEQVRENSRRKYATPREEVEASLRETTSKSKFTVGSKGEGAEDGDELHFFETE